jgi:hypothetical protein
LVASLIGTEAALVFLFFSATFLPNQRRAPRATRSDNMAQAINTNIASLTAQRNFGGQSERSCYSNAAFVFWPSY